MSRYLGNAMYGMKLVAQGIRETLAGLRSRCRVRSEASDARVSSRGVSGTACGGPRCITLSPENCYLADDLLLALEEQGTRNFCFTVEERVGEGCVTRQTRGVFSQAQIFHLAGFFDKLAARRSSSLAERYYYRKLVEYLTGVPEGPSQARGQVAVGGECGSLPRPPGGPEDLPAGEKIRQGGSLVIGPWRAKLIQGQRNVERLRRARARRPVSKANPRQWQSVLITGWYGTETTGDKAILGELAHVLMKVNPEVRITITSIDEKVSRQTNRELGLTDRIDVIDIDRAHHPEVVSNVDAVVIGGGPLMDCARIENLWKVFREANEQGAARIIFGCGVGPIRSERTERCVREICRLATAGFFRDEPSHRQALRMGAGANLTWACDPAISHVARWRARAVRDRDRILYGPPRLVALLREQTKEYYHLPDLNERNAIFARETADLFGRFIDEHPEAEVELLPMHMYWKGNDDRLFSRKVVRAIQGSDSVRATSEYLEIDRMLTRLSTANIGVAMRYHGHLFCLALGIPFLSINYTDEGGKVGNLMNVLALSEYVVEFSKFRAGGAMEKIRNLESRRADISRRLLAQTEGLVNRLDEVYREQFGVSA